MNRPIAFLSLFAVSLVYAATKLPDYNPDGPVLLDGELLKNNRFDPRVSTVYPLTVRDEDKLDGHLLARFLYLVPSLGFDFKHGFATPGKTRPHVLKVTRPSFPGETPVEFLGFSDCKTWYAVHMYFWNPHHAMLSPKAAGFVKDFHGDWVMHPLLPGVMSPLPGFTFFDFLRHHLHYRLKDKLVPDLPVHEVSLALDGKFPPYKPQLYEFHEDLPRTPSDPVLLGTRDDRVAVYQPHRAYLDGYFGESHLVRTLFLRTKLGSDVTGGLAAQGRLRPYVLSFTVPDTPDMHLVEFLGFSDCKSWYAVHVEFFVKGSGVPTYKTAGFVRNRHGDWDFTPLLPDVFSPLPGMTLPEFLQEHLPSKDPFRYKKLLDDLPVHPVTLALDRPVHRKVVHYRPPPKKEPPRQLPPPLVLDKKLFDEKKDERVTSVVGHTHLTEEKKPLRFLYLVPRLGSDLTGGLSFPDYVKPVHLPATVPDSPNEHLVEFVGFSDCDTWYGMHLEFFLHGHDVPTYRAAGFVKNDNGEWTLHALTHGVDPPLSHKYLMSFNLPTFLKEKASTQELKKMADSLPVHPLTLALTRL